MHTFIVRAFVITFCSIVFFSCANRVCFFGRLSLLFSLSVFPPTVNTRTHVHRIQAFEVNEEGKIIKLAFHELETEKIDAPSPAKTAKEVGALIYSTFLAGDYDGYAAVHSSGFLFLFWFPCPCSLSPHITAQLYAKDAVVVCQPRHVSTFSSTCMLTYLCTCCMNEMNFWIILIRLPVIKLSEIQLQPPWICQTF